MDILGNLPRGLRWFVRQPGLSWSGAVLLVLGIGANTTIFTIVDHLFFSPPPAVRAPEEVVRLNRFSAERPVEWWSYPDYAFFREHAEAFAGVGAYFPASQVVTAALDGRRSNTEVTFVSDNYFEVLGARPAEGRGLLPGSGARPQTEAVISSELRRRLFGASRGAIGAGLQLNGHDFTVVGVAPSDFRGVSPVERPPDAWVPLTARPLLTHGSESGWLERSEGAQITWLQVFGRLGSGVSPAEAQANLDLAASHLAQELGGEAGSGQGARIQESFQFQYRVLEELGRLSRLLMAVVGAVLLIAGANVAILLLARAASKRREYGVRMAVGASRGRIVGHLLVDSLALAVPGAVGGYLLAFWSSDLAARALPFTVVGDLRPDLRVLGFTLAVAVLVALLFGALPALEAARSDIVSQLTDGHAGMGRSRLREALVVAQVGLSFLLVAGALLFVRSLVEVHSEDLGFADEGRLLITTELGHHGYEDADVRSFVQEAVERMEGVAGVERVTTTLMVPFGGMWSTHVTAVNSERRVAASLNAVGPDYFRVMEVPLVAGRSFTWAERAGARPVVIVNQAASERLWPETEALGATVDLGDGTVRTVVGVARNATYHDVGEDPVPHVYLPTLQAGRKSVTFVAQTALEPMASSEPLLESIRTIDGDLSFSRVEPLAAAVRRVTGRYRVGATLVSLFGLLALVLAAIGLYAVLSYLVVQRRRVIGIQMALGATRRRVAARVVGRGLVLSTVGIVVGIAGAVLAVRLITGFLYGVSPADPGPYVLVALVLLVVAALAGAVPALRALHVDPVRVLREE